MIVYAHFLCWFTASFDTYVAVLSIFHFSISFMGLQKKTFNLGFSLTKTMLMYLLQFEALREYLRLWDTLQKSNIETANGYIWQVSRFAKKKHFGYYSIVFGGVAVLKCFEGISSMQVQDTIVSVHNFCLESCSCRRCSRISSRLYKEKDPCHVPNKGTMGA